jgi:hypothetical protein
MVLNLKFMTKVQASLDLSRNVDINDNEFEFLSKSKQIITYSETGRVPFGCF